MKKITPCLWFDSEAEAAANFYVSVFKNSKIVDITRYLTDTPSHKPNGSVQSVEFELDGNRFLALNGGPYFKISEAVSFVIECEDQAEIDFYSAQLSAVSQSEMCGWVKDKFGVSWQIVPSNITQYTNNPVMEKAKRSMDAILNMKKIDIAVLDKIINDGK